jgi:hypothetical protein
LRQDLFKRGVLNQQEFNEGQQAQAEARGTWRTRAGRSPRRTACSRKPARGSRRPEGAGEVAPLA